MDAVYLGDAIDSCNQESSGPKQHQTLPLGGEDEGRVLLLRKPEHDAQIVSVV